MSLEERYHRPQLEPWASQTSDIFSGCFTTYDVVNQLEARRSERNSFEFDNKLGKWPDCCSLSKGDYSSGHHTRQLYKTLLNAETCGDSPFTMHRAFTSSCGVKKRVDQPDRQTEFFFFPITPSVLSRPPQWDRKNHRSFRKKMPVAQPYLEQSSMKDGFAEGFLLGFKAGLAVAAAEPKKTTESEEKRKLVIDGKQRAKAWAIQKGFIKR